MDGNIQRIIQEINEAIEDADLGYETLEERQGNLRGLPRGIIGKIMGSFKLAGQNSKVELYKANAKQKDLTQAQRAVAGVWERRWGDRYDRWKTQEVEDKEREVEQFRAAHQGVVVQVNGEWAFFAEYDPYGPANKVYTLFGSDGTYAGSGRKYIEHLSQNELSNYIDFKNDEVDVYLVTVDTERIKLRDERHANRVGRDSMASVRREALKKFVQTRVKDVIKEVDRSVHGVARDISKLANDMLDPRATEVEISKAYQDVDAQLDRINDIMDDTRRLALQTNNLLTDDSAIDRSGWRHGISSYAVRSFSQYVKDMKKAMDI